MPEPVAYLRAGRCGVITVDHPPVNALGQAVRQGLLRALAEGLADAGAEILVVVAAGKTFMAGADIREFGQPVAAPSLPEVVAAFDCSPKPVVAGLHGTALGGGLEVALACHFRIALRSTRMGLPEVKLGLIPGAGGTQRLPRLVGAAQALAMICEGEPISAANALAMGLIDAIDDGTSAEDAALRFAAKILDETWPVLPVSQRQDRIQATDMSVFSDWRQRVAQRAPGLFSPARCVDAVEAAVTLPFAQGVARERTLFLECMASPQRSGLIHAFLAQRASARIPGLPSLSASASWQTGRTVGIIGAGTMGTGIAMCFADAGIPVILVESDNAALDRGVATMARSWQSAVAKGRLTEADMQARQALVRPSPDFVDLGAADLVVEAVYEDLEVKKQVFSKLNNICRPGAILTTNTSTLDINAIAAATSRPQDVAGMHFFSPAHVMRLVEIVRGEKTSDTVLITLMDLSKRIGKIGVSVGVCYGFVGNRMLHQRMREATALVLAGASPADIDRVLTTFGFPMGPFVTGDLAGLDIGWRAREARRAGGDMDAPARTWLDLLVEMGRHGQKTGAGVYRYQAGDRTPRPDSAVDDVIARERARLGIVPRQVSDQEILERCLYVMINEGARILEEGIASRASDIDVIWVHGYGFPAFRGGPMFWADQLGLDHVLSSVRQIYQATGERYWHPAPRLERLASDGGTFGGLLAA